METKSKNGMDQEIAECLSLRKMSRDEFIKKYPASLSNPEKNSFENETSSWSQIVVLFEKDNITYALANPGSATDQNIFAFNNGLIGRLNYSRSDKNRLINIRKLWVIPCWRRKHVAEYLIKSLFTIYCECIRNAKTRITININASPASSKTAPEYKPLTQDELKAFYHKFQIKENDSDVNRAKRRVIVNAIYNEMIELIKDCKR